jgi:hypothetical protein
MHRVIQRVVHRVKNWGSLVRCSNVSKLWITATDENDYRRMVSNRFRLNRMVSMVQRTTQEEYQRVLDEAAQAMEDEATLAEVQASIDERLNALGAEGIPIGEAEQAAASAESPERPMTPGMIKFAQGVISGMTRRDAYRAAYQNAKGSDATISACAHRLSKDPRVARMIKIGWEETSETLADDLASTKRYVLRALVAMSRGAKQEGSRLKALELLGRSAGIFREDTTAKDAPLSADQLRKELQGHLKLVADKPRKAHG